jgi:hypothetical protein
LARGRLGRRSHSFLRTVNVICRLRAPCACVALIDDVMESCLRQCDATNPLADAFLDECGELADREKNRAP